MLTRGTPALIAVIAAIALTACGSSSSTSNTSTATSTPAPTGQAASPPASAAGQVVKLSASPTGSLAFNVTSLHATAGTVTLQMTNPGGSGVPHGIAVQGNGVDKDSTIVRSGGVATVTATLKPGTYTFYCPVPGHEAAGMKGTLTVA